MLRNLFSLQLLVNKNIKKWQLQSFNLLMNNSVSIRYSALIYHDGLTIFPSGRPLEN